MITIEEITKPVKAIIINDEELRCVYDFKNSKASEAILTIPLYEKQNKKDSLAMNTISLIAKKYPSRHSKEPMFEFGVLIDTNKNSNDWMPITLPVDRVLNYDEFKREVVNEFGSSYFYQRIKAITVKEFDEHISIVTDIRYITVYVDKEGK